MPEKKRAFTLRLPDDLVKKIDHYAVDEGQHSRSTAIQAIVELYFAMRPWATD